MMKSRNLAIMAALIVVLAGINFMQKNNHQKSTSGSAVSTLIEGQWSVDTVGRLAIGYGAEENVVSLVKNPDHSWAVSSAWQAPGETQNIANLLLSLVALKGEFRSDDAAVLGDYQLARDQAVSIHAYANDGSSAFELLVGKATDGAPGNFVRLSSDNRVHATQIDLLAILGLYSGPGPAENKHFIHLKPLGFDQGAVDKIVLSDDRQTTAMTKTFADTTDRATWEWELDADPDTALARTKVDALLNALLGIRAVDVDNPAGDTRVYGLQEATRKATIFLADGSSQVLLFGSRREAGPGGSSGSTLPAGQWLQVEGKNEVWIITDYTVNNIFKNVDELKAG
jgi:hypothetical protein